MCTGRRIMTRSYYQARQLRRCRDGDWRTDDIAVGSCFGTGESCQAHFDGKDCLVSHDEEEVL